MTNCTRPTLYQRALYNLALVTAPVLSARTSGDRGTRDRPCLPLTANVIGKRETDTGGTE